MGKNSIAQIALGLTPESEYKDNLRHVSKVSALCVARSQFMQANIVLFFLHPFQRLVGSVGLLFTNRSKAEVKK
jgi:hypothetical protein